MKMVQNEISWLVHHCFMFSTGGCLWCCVFTAVSTDANLITFVSDGLIYFVMDGKTTPGILCMCFTVRLEGGVLGEMERE